MSGAIARCISDLRLITAALDAGHDRLSGAIDAFRRRTEEQLKLAGMALDWTSDEQLDALGASPHAALEILRILQELVTNAVTHSGASRVAVQVSRGTGAEQAMLLIRVTDNGNGFDPAAAHSSGRGLANMQARALRLDGRVGIGRTAGGGGDIVVAIALDRLCSVR